MKKLLILLTIILIIIIGFFAWKKSNQPEENTNTPSTPASVIVATPEEKEPDIIAPDVAEPDLPSENDFIIVTLSSSNPGAELSKLVGLKNAFTTLSINRIDDKHLWTGMTLVVPTDFSDPSLWEFMPTKINSASEIPKLVIISQRTQAFGFYENGNLVRSGPISSGKKSTPTANKLYFMNWKGEEVVSTFDDEWILKWNFNIDNFGGIGLHYYAMPGYPASHSCVRMYEADAKWMYDWGKQWKLASDGQTKIANGTPVIIFGDYDFGKTAPWKNLPNDPEATKVTSKELEALVTKNLDKIIGE